ncbi:MAG: TRAP transporter fused permease subunit [Synergistaceae bacterium]|nr:TRAP transporter fused permease subunit [Synergistaceae bacterium]
MFMNVHIRARKAGLRGLPADQLPVVAEVMRRDGHLLIPIAVIIAALLMKYTPLKAGFVGIVSVLAVSSLRRGTRMSMAKIVNAMTEGARGALGVAMACALVGFVVGTSSLTSLGLTISNNIIEISDNNLMLTLVMSMIACLVLGMGLPTTANYIVCSTIIAPALVGMKVIPIAAHLFVFYFGIMADLTPPVCLAAFTGAGIAGASPAKTGLTATRIALASYLLPFVFVYNPMLLVQDIELKELAILTISAVLGVIFLAVSLEGWLFRPLVPWERLVIGIVSIVSIHHDILLSVVSSLILLIAAVFLKKTTRDPTGRPA